MARLHLVHWDPAAARGRRHDLAALGHDVAFQPLDGTALLRALRASAPDAFVIDLSRLPSHGREVGQALRCSPATRHVQLVFVDGEPEKVARVRETLPDATFASWRGIGAALKKALATPLAAPVVPPSRIYTGRTVAQKLGIKAGQTVAVLAGPRGVPALLAPLPEHVRFTARAEAGAGLLLWFVHTDADLQRGVARVAADLGDRVVWVIWRKQAGRSSRSAAAGVNGNVVRAVGLAAGLVDFKVCAIDDTWSALAFKRRAR